MRLVFACIKIRAAELFRHNATLIRSRPIPFLELNAVINRCPRVMIFSNDGTADGLIQDLIDEIKRQHVVLERFYGQANIAAEI